MSDDPTSTESDESEASAPTWRKGGRCGSCQYFNTDYGEAPDLYGNCKMYPRTGSRESSDFACPEYKPLDGFDKLTKSVRTDLDISLAKERRPFSSQSSIPSGGIKRRPNRPVRPERDRGGMVHRPAQPVAVKRRPADEDSSAQRAASSGLSGDAHRALSGGGGRPVSPDELREALLEVIETFVGVEEVEIAERWQDGSLILESANPDLKPHIVPLDSFWNKIVMIRDRLRVLEQKINSHKGLSSADKIQMQQYITGCYGSLTTFNVLFKDKRDKFSSK